MTAWFRQLKTSLRLMTLMMRSRVGVRLALALVELVSVAWKVRILLVLSGTALVATLLAVFGSVPLKFRPCGLGVLFLSHSSSFFLMPARTENKTCRCHEG